MMARLSNQAKIKRLRSQGYSRKEIARVTGSSISAVGRAERGETKGESFAAPLGEFFKLGKGSKARAVSGEFSLPSAKAAPARAKPSMIERAAGQLTQQYSDALLVVHVTRKSTGKSYTLFARGGTSKAHLQGNLRGVISSQYKSQYRGEALDWDDVTAIDIDEY